MCLDTADACWAALLVPTAEVQFAIFVDEVSIFFDDGPERVRVVAIARPDSFPAAAKYGGSVELLKSILSTMNVTSP